MNIRKVYRWYELHRLGNLGDSPVSTLTQAEFINQDFDTEEEAVEVLNDYVKNNYWSFDEYHLQTVYIKN